MRQVTRSPVDGREIARDLATDAEVDRALQAACDAASAWRAAGLPERIRRVSAFVDAVSGQADAIADELTVEVGRPIRHSPGELRGFEDRARTMIELSASALADIPASDRPGFTRFVRREPVGTVLALAAWNYPYLIAVNAVVPALLAGNTVILKHSDQTPSCAERLGQAAEAAGLPPGVFRFLHVDHDLVSRMVRDRRVDLVAFTGSVAGGRAVHTAAAGTFKAVNLELGGNDAAYVREDADLAFTVENLVDGALFNAGQSCCAIERVFVHRSRYREVVDAMTACIEGYRLGDPRDPTTTLGPVIRLSAAERIRGMIADAVGRGAKARIDPSSFPAAEPGSPYLAPQLLTDVTPDMEIAREEIFGPVVSVVPVDGDDDAVTRINDSRYGLTASIWTDDEDAALALADRLEVGTVFQNRCDALDPELAWVGVKDSGRGCTLSTVGFEHLTRPKSFHLRARPS